ncbi:cytochrome P450 9e2-like [Melitaea cinxia]|uniref:cytochrome P450 9e2-like n=1 Tax=Melitaea cinxia TaxID=113334 RepID=UPI001E271FB9|nr:cytochrome P450 9e2-like [Melitaea cinxia]
MIIILIWSAVLVAVFVLFFRQKYSRFSEYGVKHMKVVPLFGNMLRIVLRKEHLAENLNNIYTSFSEERYEFLRPTIVIRDLDLIKKITVKDFENFLDHRGFTDEKVDPLFARNLFSLKGQEWKDMRSTLSPAFTSSKIKLMVPFMDEVGEKMIRALQKKIKDSDGYIDIDSKDLTSRYTNDVIASCAFGLKVDSYTDENNQFYEMGKAAVFVKLRQIILIFASSAFPFLIKILKQSIFTPEVKNFFIDLVQNTMKDREARNITRPDLIHLLMEAKKGNLSHDDKDGTENENVGYATVEESSIGKKTVTRTWSDVDLIAQAVLFFIAGFESVSIAASFALFELARHPDIQERLAREIKEQNVKNGGKVDFSSLQSMKYLDMVISEIIRLWPPGLSMERICTKDYNLGKPNSKAEKDFIIRKGEVVWMPIWCFHRDPNYFPNPEKFDPERFSDDNKHEINQMAYMPFGFGPRNCIGSRFALCELKALLYQILLHLEVSPSSKTVFATEFDTDFFNPRLKGGHWLRFKSRN